MNRLGLVIGGMLLVLMLASSTLFIVDQRQVAVVYDFGQIKEVIKEPGLNFKLPPPFQNVAFLDSRIQTLDSPETRPIFTAEKKSLVIDWLVQVAHHRPAPVHPQQRRRHQEPRGPAAPIVHAAFNEEVTKRTVGDVLSSERDKVMQRRSQSADRRRQVVRHRDPRRAHQARRLRRQHHRFDLQPHGLGAQAGGQPAARHRRRGGREDPRRCRPAARGDRRRCLSRRAEGQGRGRRARPRRSSPRRSAAIPQFAQFYRSLEAYRASFHKKCDVHGRRPASSDFFKAMQGSAATPAGPRERRRPGRRGSSGWRGSSSGTSRSAPSR